MSKPINSVKAVSLVGAASILNILFGLVKMKLAAMLLGPAGVGLIGLFQQLVATVSTLFGLGMRNSGTRQIAEACSSRSGSDLAAVRRALYCGSVILAALGAAMFFATTDLFALYIFEDPLRSAELAWLALGVGLTVLAASQQALLNGLRHVRDLALITVLTGAMSATIGITALLLWREHAVVVFVLSSPIASFVFGQWFVAHLSNIPDPPSHPRRIAQEFVKIAKLGTSVMLATFLVVSGQLIIRSIIRRDLGVDELGFFTAAWLMSQNYVSFLLAAITLDYYPRLSSAVGNRSEATRILNEQTEISLLFAAPLFLAMMSLGPYALWLLYSAEFAGASNILRWLIMGDIVRIAAYPLDYALLAFGMGSTFAALRFLGISVFVFACFVLTPGLGLVGAGIGYIMMYVAYVPMMYLLLLKKFDMKWNLRVFLGILSLLGVSGMIWVCALFSSLLALCIGGLLTSLVTVMSFRQLRRLSFQTGSWAGTIQ